MAESLEQLLRESKHIDACRGPRGHPPLIKAPFMFAGKMIYEILTKEIKGESQDEGD